MKEYALLYPEYSYVFLGDNGQADVRAVSKMLDHPFINIKVAYIHQVQNRDETFGLPIDDDFKMNKIVFFTNYAQAALHAFKNDWISAPGLCRVAMATVEDFDKLPQTEVDEKAREDLHDTVNEILAYMDFLIHKQTPPVHKFNTDVIEAVRALLPLIKPPVAAQQTTASGSVASGAGSPIAVARRHSSTVE
jgi:hypothetical protein